jgi:lysyl-tRNA synthetase class 2
MADLVEEMICTIAEKHFGGLKIEHKNPDGTARKTINLQRPWRRVRMTELFELEAGQPFNPKASTAVAHPILSRRLVEKVVGKPIRGALFEGELAPTDEEGTAIRQIILEKAKGGYIDRLTRMGPAEYLVEVYEKLIEHTLIDPTYVTHVPSVIIPLARKATDDPFFADVYELAINGQEISPGYSELNDPDVQAENFAHQVGEDQQQVDHDFLNALRYGMPPAGGMGLGIDRLVMMLTGAESIRDVILFPLMKPLDKDAKLNEEPANPT